MSRKNKAKWDKEDIKNLTKRERLLSRCFSMIFHLNNNQQRYSLEFRGYMLILSKLNFENRCWDILEEHNFTNMSYSESCNVVLEINKRLHKELCKYSENEEDWSEYE